MHIYCVLDKTAEKNLTHKDSKRKSWNSVCYLDGERPFDADLEREETDLDWDLDAERRVLGDLLQSIFRVSYYLSTRLPMTSRYSSKPRAPAFAVATTWASAT